MPTPPVKARRQRGRPQKQSRLAHVPTDSDRKGNGGWVHPQVLGRLVAAIVGSRDSRQETYQESLPRLIRLAVRVLGRQLTHAEADELRALVVLRCEPASVITRVLAAWRHSLGERQVRDLMYGSKPTESDSAPRVLKYERFDKNGTPVGPPACDESGRPILHVYDDVGQLRPWNPGEPVPTRRVVVHHPPLKKFIYR